MASAYLGLHLTQVTLIASALSVGIGFGLQAVVQNFVSGLILLVERPVKVGDWVALGDIEGDIRRINVRATEIQMGDRSTMIVADSELITKTVRNVTWGAPLGQVQISFTVGYDADLDDGRGHPDGRVQADARRAEGPGAQRRAHRVQGYGRGLHRLRLCGDAAGGLPARRATSCSS